MFLQKLTPLSDYAIVNDFVFELLYTSNNEYFKIKTNL